MPIKPVVVDGEHNIRSCWYQVGSTVTTCWKCKKPTKVFSVMLPADHEVLVSIYVDETDDGTDWDFDPSINGVLTKEWRDDHGAMTVYFNLKAVAFTVLETLAQMSGGHYRMDRYNNHDSDTLINHCEHCGVRQSERALNRSGDSGAIDNYAFAFVTHDGPPAPIAEQMVSSPFTAFGSDYVKYSGNCVIIMGLLGEEE